ncbi:MAG: hypothetical protein JJT87_02515 [Halomonas sp.]|nr:hypothetical protein [Halomonas sp.]MCC5900790.1 hypothetical protein [Halomonas sp.]
MINAILFLYRGKRIPFMAYRLLHNLLVEDGVFYYTKKEKQEFDVIINAVGACAKLEITYETGDAVENLVKTLDYTRQVAVCDIGSGDHSILVNGFRDGVFSAFDPYWDNVKKGESHDERYETFAPYMEGSRNSINLRIWAEHLFAERAGSGFQMGAKSMRFATVLTST